MGGAGGARKAIIHMSTKDTSIMKTAIIIQTWGQQGAAQMVWCLRCGTADDDDLSVESRQRNSDAELVNGSQ